MRLWDPLLLVKGGEMIGLEGDEVLHLTLGADPHPGYKVNPYRWCGISVNSGEANISHPPSTF